MSLKDFKIKVLSSNDLDKIKIKAYKPCDLGVPNKDVITWGIDELS